MTCQQDQAELAQYAMAALDAAAAQRIVSHLRECPDCAGQVGGLTVALSFLGSVPRASIVGDWPPDTLDGLRLAAVCAALTRY